MYFNKYVRFISSKNRSSAIRVASLYRKAWGRDLENAGYSQGSCEYTVLSDFPATKRGFSCLSEQFASHMFKQNHMYDNMIRMFLDFFYKKAVQDPENNAGVLSGLVSNDASKRNSAGQLAISLIKADPRALRRLMTPLHSRALPGFLDEVRKHLLKGDGYFLFDAHPEMAKISQATRKEMDKVTNPNTKFKKKQKGVEEKVNLLKRLTNFRIHDSDRDKVLNTYFIQHGKTLGQLLKLDSQSKSILKADSDLARGVSRSRVKQIVDDDPRGWANAVRSAIESTQSLKKALRSAIITSYEHGEGFTERAIDEIAQMMLPAFRRSARYEEWIERLLNRDRGEEILENGIKVYLDDVLMDMDEYQVQDMVNEERQEFRDSYL